LSDVDVAAVVAYLKSLTPRVEEKEKEAGEGEKEHKAEKRKTDAAEKGKELAGKLGCLGCHSFDGSVSAGPSFKGLFGRQVEFEGGGKGLADEAYLRESIARPGAKIVKGFPDIMPGFEGKISEEDLAALVAYVKSLK